MKSLVIIGLSFILSIIIGFTIFNILYFLYVKSNSEAAALLFFFNLIEIIICSIIVGIINLLFYHTLLKFENYKVILLIIIILCCLISIAVLYNPSLSFYKNKNIDLITYIIFPLGFTCIINYTIAFDLVKKFNKKMPHSRDDKILDMINRK
jgi:hypothetical protein